MVGGAVGPALLTVGVGARGGVMRPPATTHHYAFNGAAREANALGDDFMVKSEINVVLDLATLCWGEGFPCGFSFCLSNSRVPQ